MLSASPRSNARRFLELPSRDQRLLCEAWWRLLAAALRLWVAPRRTVATALVESAPRARSSEAGGTAAQVTRAVGRAAAHHLRPMTCLPRSIALQRMLARRGIASRMQIGVSKEGGAPSGITAHAWIEVDGEPVGEPQAIEERFLPLLGTERFITPSK